MQSRQLIFLLLLPLWTVGQDLSPLTVLNDSLFVEGSYADMGNPQTIFLECELSDGIIKSISSVDKVTDSSRTIVVKLISEILSVQNPFNQALSYKAYGYSHNTSSYLPLPVYPVHKGLGSHEIFPYLLKRVRVSDFQLGDIKKMYEARNAEIERRKMAEEARRIEEEDRRLEEKMLKAEQKAQQRLERKEKRKRGK